MTTVITAQVTPQGLLIPHAALGDWNINDLEVVRKRQALMVRPKRDATESRAKVQQALRHAGLLYEPDWETPSDTPSDRAGAFGRNASPGPTTVRDHYCRARRPRMTTYYLDTSALVKCYVQETGHFFG